MDANTNHGRDGPILRELSRPECEDVLARNHLGRIAFAFASRVDIAPIHYVFSNQWIYYRTSQGSKVSTIAHHHWVAFEIDECESFFDWRSVVVKGSCHVLDAGTSTNPDPAYFQGIATLRTIMPETLKSSDPVPFRQTVMRIHLDEVTGIESRSAGIS